jgi:hypothetical protein
MTGAPTNSGILTDKEGTGFPGIRIDDKPLTVLNFVQRYLDAIPKKAKVFYQITDGKVSKIWEDKGEQSQPAANSQSNLSQQPGNNQSSCTSPEKPGIKTVEGQIVLLDKPAHKITLKARDGSQHTFIWAPALDADFSKLNQWWFCKVTGEHEADVDLWRATAQGFFKRPDDWPFAKGGNSSGGRPYTPRNERPMIYESSFKSCAELVRPDDFKGMDYAARVEAVRMEAEKIAKWMITNGGA